MSKSGLHFGMRKKNGYVVELFHVHIRFVFWYREKQKKVELCHV